MNRKNIIFRCFGVPVLILSLVFAIYAKTTLNESTWTETPLLIDGKNTDWQDVKPLEKKKMGVAYAFKNDGSNLYALFVFKDPNFLSTLSSSGMTIWLDKENKKKKHYGINFQRRTITADHFIAILEKQQGPLPENQKNEIKKKESYTILQNGVVNKDSDTIIPIQAASDKAPSFYAAQAPGMLVFEFRIPLDNISGQVVGIGSAPGQQIAVCFEWGGVTQEYKEAKKKRGPSRESSYKDGVATSMPGSEEGEIGASDDTGGDTSTDFAYSDTPRKYSIWVPLKLGEKK